jgi:hypothetical protein
MGRGMHHRQGSVFAARANASRFACSTLLLVPLSTALACADDETLDDDPPGATEGWDESETGAPDPQLGETGGDEVELEVTLTIDGRELGEALFTATEIELAAEVEGPAPEFVVFFRNDELLTIDDEAPFETEVVVGNVDDVGLEDVLVFTAVAYDAAGHDGADVVLVPVSLPDRGEVEWEQLGAQGQRWVDVELGADGSLLLTGSDALTRVSAAGELDQLREFDVPITAATASSGGGVIALASSDTTLVSFRVDAEGQTEALEFLDGFGAGTPADVRLGADDQLLVSSVAPYAGEPSGRVSRIIPAPPLTLDWHHYLVDDGEVGLPEAPALAIGPAGEVYATVTFADGDARRLQVRRIAADGATDWTHEELGSNDARHATLLVTEHGVFAGGRREGQAVILRLDEDGEAIASLAVGGLEVVALAAVGDELVYASRHPVDGAHGLEVGRLQLDGTRLWTTDTDDHGTWEEARDLAVSPLGHVHLLSQLGSGQPRLQRIHP